MTESLAGRVIAIAEARELDVFAALLERRGAQVLRYPLVKIIDAPDPAPVLAWISTAAAGGFDDLIVLTGEGLRRLLGCIDRHQPALRTPFLGALQRMRKITRGPKPARALRELGLGSDLAAVVPTTAGSSRRLRAIDLRGRRVGVQLYGAEPNRPLVEFLEPPPARRCAGGTLPLRRRRGRRGGAGAARAHARGEVDAIAFTSKAQVERLFRAAPHRIGARRAGRDPV